MFFRSQTCYNANGKHLAPGSFWHFGDWLNSKRSQSSLRDTHFKDSCLFDSFIRFSFSCLFQQNLIKMNRNKTSVLLLRQTIKQFWGCARDSVHVCCTGSVVSGGFRLTSQCWGLPAGGRFQRLQQQVCGGTVNLQNRRNEMSGLIGSSGTFPLMQKHSTPLKYLTSAGCCARLLHVVEVGERVTQTSCHRPALFQFLQPPGVEL